MTAKAGCRVPNNWLTEFNEIKPFNIFTTVIVGSHLSRSFASSIPYARVSLPYYSALAFAILLTAVEPR